jgi:SNF2 family DNA or RNA helicase
VTVLRRRGARSQSIEHARVDLNPHQVDAALFALRPPFSKGVILADEAGLGKTIEAGIVIAQRWAEREARASQTLQEKLAAQKRVNGLERQRSRKRRELFEEQDRIDAERDSLIESIEQQLKLSHATKRLFTLRWLLE